jgi:hypothetical protein
MLYSIELRGHPVDWGGKNTGKKIQGKINKQVVTGNFSGSCWSSEGPG